MADGSLCPECQHVHQGDRKCGFPVWTTMPRQGLAGNIPCECKRTEKRKWGFVFNLTSAWIGVHYSKRERRTCINFPFPCLTLWITKPGGKVP